MKILVKTVIEVDPDDYRAEYGTTETPAEIREQIAGRVEEAALSTMWYLPLTVNGVPTTSAEEKAATNAK